MRKLNLTAKQLQALYPPVPQAFEHTIANTLHDLANGKEQPVMKKKISAALVVAIILIILTLSAAIALTQSNLISLMFGSGAILPEELEEAITRHGATVSTDDIEVALNEYLYDGEKLHLQWSIANVSGRQVMVTMSRFQINGKYVQVENRTLFESEDHALAHVMGGGADDAVMPINISNFATYTNDQDENGPLISGNTVEVSCDLYIWELLHAPVLIGNSLKISEEDYAKVRGLHRLPVDGNGLCILDKFVRDDDSVDAETGEDYRRAYERLGWAKLEKVQPVKFDVVLEPKPIQQVQPTKTSFEMDDFTLAITRMIYMQTGGTLELLVYPKGENRIVNPDSPYLRDLVVLNADTMELLNGSKYYDNTVDYAVSYQIMLEPVLGNMPSAILITPGTGKKIGQKNTAADPKKDRSYTYTLEDAVRVELAEQP